MLLLFICIFINYLATLIGSLLVYIIKQKNNTILSIAYSCSAGIMIAASFFSLLLPALELVEHKSLLSSLMLPIGFICGVILLRVLDYYIPHIHLISQIKEGKHTNISRQYLTFLAMTLHNIPEGFAIGVAFASQQNTIGIMLTLAIAMQNIPEGAAVSLPLHSFGKSKKEALFLGQLSGLVEIPAGIIGYLFASQIEILLPFSLCLASGAMLFICVEELLPEAILCSSRDKSALICMSGFVFMMILDILLS